jgi:predicted ATP-binding protein involved in virulence
MLNDPTALLRLNRLRLENFRSFRDCDLVLHPELNVLVAENGQGKTAVLEAIAIALDAIVTPLTSGAQSKGFLRTDIRRIRDDLGNMVPCSPVSFRAEGIVDGVCITWARSLKGSTEKDRTDRTGLRTLNDAIDAWSEELCRFDDGPLKTLPMVAFYGTGRLWSEHRLTKSKAGRSMSSSPRSTAYADALSSSSSFKSFAAWYEDISNSINQHSASLYGRYSNPIRQLAAVRDAVKKVLNPTGWTDIDWVFQQFFADTGSFEPGYVSVEHPEKGRLPLDLLSDGVRNMVAMVADLAHRCVRLNPHLGEEAAAGTPGILLIDELDMHLHPRWQQLVIGLLRDAFPRFQLIISTHSPHLLSTVAAESIRVIGTAGSVSTPDYQTLGNESADILARIMGVDPTPEVAEARWLTQYREMLGSGTHQSRTGHELWKGIIEHFGEDHGALQEIHVLRSLHDFKESHPELSK